jgi:hypothetical protein
MMLFLLWLLGDLCTVARICSTHCVGTGAFICVTVGAVMIARAIAWCRQFRLWCLLSLLSHWYLRIFSQWVKHPELGNIPPRPHTSSWRGAYLITGADLPFTFTFHPRVCLSFHFLPRALVKSRFCKPLSWLEYVSKAKQRFLHPITSDLPFSNGSRSVKLHNFLAHYSLNVRHLQKWTRSVAIIEVNDAQNSQWQLFMVWNWRLLQYVI